MIREADLLTAGKRARPIGEPRTRDLLVELIAFAVSVAIATAILLAPLLALRWAAAP